MLDMYLMFSSSQVLSFLGSSVIQDQLLLLLTWQANKSYVIHKVIWVISRHKHNCQMYLYL